MYILYSVYKRYLMYSLYSVYKRYLMYSLYSVYKHIFFTSTEAWSSKINKKIGTPVNAECQSFVSPGLHSVTLRRNLK